MIIESCFKFLDFDSNLFGFTVVKLLKQNYSCEELGLELNKLKSLGIDLVYWESSTKLSSYTENLVCQPVTYRISLVASEQLKKDSAIVAADFRYLEHLQVLGHLIAEKSRFGQDLKMKRELAKVLYDHWIIASLKKECANEFWVYRLGKEIAGGITLINQNKGSEIGLLAVNREMQGKGIGTLLVEAAKAYFCLKGASYCQVITQYNNSPARTLYERCGFKMVKRNYFYHFWL